MRDKNQRMSLRTELGGADVRGREVAKAPEHPHSARETRTREDNLPLLGLFAVGFAVLSIFTFAPVFVPLGLVLGVIALFIGQIGLGIAAIFLSVIGIVTSPTLMTVVGLGAFWAWLGL